MSEQINIREEILRYLRAQPFARFTIVTTSGDRYEVVDPNSVGVGNSVLSVFPPPGNGHILLRLNQISALEVLEAV